MEGELELSFPRGNFGEGTLAATRTAEGWSRVRVAVRTLSGVAEELGLDEVRFVKIDVEGYEPEVLRGARDWLASRRPAAFLFETNEGEEPGGSADILALFAELDYALYSIPKRLFSLALTPFRREGDGGQGGHDMLAIRRESEPEIRSRFRVTA